ncbi:MAG: HD domain-containing protein [Gemmataceae bacterium]|nr:HD domain-containing protein [Gemmataceae bacterium]
MNEAKLRSMQSVLQAASMAGRAHQGQLRKDNETPYVCHVFRVCLILRDLFGFDDPRMLIATLLHDTIEDTLIDFDDLESAFGAEIALWVSLLTKDKRLPESKREKAYLARLARAPWQVKACKLADLCDNMLDASALSADKLATSRARYKQYWITFRNWSEPQLKKPLEIMAHIMAELG